MRMQFPSWLTPILVSQIAISVNVLFTAICALVDAFAFRRPARLSPKQISERSWPSLSVLIPARNEEAVIAACVESLLAQAYPGHVEVLVLDDRSEDRTGEILDALASRDSRLRVLRGGELLDGWKGKPNALRQLVTEASGDLLLFTDADCHFAPDSLTNAVAHKSATRADCLSLMPRLLCGSFWEHVILPLQPMIVFLTLPIPAVAETSNPTLAAANGAFLLITRETYLRIGGHTAVRGEMAEDIKFSQHVKSAGLRLVYGDGSTTYSVRMYDSLPAIWSGFSKNLFSAMGRSMAFLCIWSLFLYTTQIQPWLFLIYAAAVGDNSVELLWISVAHIVVSMTIRLYTAARFGQNPLYGWTNPFGWVAVISMAWNSAYLALSGKGHTWKGRTYAPERTNP